MSGLITKGLGSSGNLITMGLGKCFKIEVKKVVEVGVAPYWEIRVFVKRIPVLGDKVFDFKQAIKITGIVDLHGLILALQDETPSTEDDILELLSIYNELKLQIQFEEVVEQKTLELSVETKKLLDMLFEKLKKEVEKNEHGES